MNSTQLDAVAFSHFSQFTKQLALPDIAARPPSTSAFLYLLPPALVLLVVDLVAQYSNRQALIANAEESLKDREEIEKLGGNIQEGLLKIKEVEKKLASEKLHSKYLSRTLWKQRNFARHRERLQACNAEEPQTLDSPPKYTVHNTASTATQTEKPTGVGAPFMSFCERLLFQNKIWKQQREIKQLKIALSSVKMGGSENAFQAFCDRLILTNKIKKQQKQVDGLIGEAEKLKRSRVAAVTRAAKQMVLDVRKERMTEEFVTDLIAELVECRQTVNTLRAEHERQIAELAEDYRKDCQRLSREVEFLKLSRDSRLVEQELSNVMEDDLVDRLSQAESHAAYLDLQLHDTSMTISSGYASEDAEAWSGSELSIMSTSTCVGSGGDRSPNVKATFTESPKGKMAAHSARRIRLSPLKMALRTNSSSSLRISPLKKASNPKFDSVPLAVIGFSFNPLFFGTPVAARNEDATETESQHARASSLLSILPPEQRKAGPIHKLREQPKPIPWRF